MKAGNNIDYSFYSFEDFLQDEYFLHSMNHPNEESKLFWNKYLISEPSNIEEFLAAKSYIESIPVNKGLLSEEEITGLWERIEQTTLKSENKTGKRRRLFITAASAAAACIAFFLLLPALQDVVSPQDLDIYSFVDKNQDIDFKSTSSQLILSDERVVLMDEKESVIVYDSTSIKVSGEDLSKNDVATYNQLIVPKGKRSMLTLSDGTKVWVNAGTRVVYPTEFDKKERELYVDGEIYINVAPNKNWPFVVKTKDLGVKVLGTEFNVTAYESDKVKRIVLVSGSVMITDKESTNNNSGITLSPNRMYEYKDSKGQVEYVDVFKYISWKEGMYVFNNEKLAVILERLSHYYGENIEFDEESASLRCSGKLDLKDDLDKVLTGLTYTVPVDYRKQDGKLTIKYKP